MSSEYINGSNTFLWFYNCRRIFNPLELHNYLTNIYMFCIKIINLSLHMRYTSSLIDFSVNKCISVTSSNTFTCFLNEMNDLSNLHSWWKLVAWNCQSYSKINFNSSSLSPFLNYIFYLFWTFKCSETSILRN